MANALISVGLPVYNGSPYLKELIESILAQSFGDFEFVISDNASEDDTEQVCRSYANSDRRIRYYRNPENIGLIRNYNRVFELSTTPYFKWVSHDDLYEPRYLELCFPPIRDDPSISVSHSETTLIDSNGGLLPYHADLHCCVDAANRCRWFLDRSECAVGGWAPKRFRDVLAHQIMCAPIYGLMRRELLQVSGLNKSFFGSDKLLLAEMALLGRFSIVPEIMFKKRMHSTMTSLLDGTEQSTHLDPNSGNRSLQSQKLAGYLAMLRRRGLSLPDRAACLYYLMVHSASAVLPLDWKYRPELIPGDIAEGLQRMVGLKAGRKAGV